MRVEAGTNLIGGQPFSVANLREVRKVRQCYLVGWQLMRPALLKLHDTRLRFFLLFCGQS